MPEKNNVDKGSESLMEKIEQQLDEIFSKKKVDIEKELQERIKSEQVEAEKRMKKAENDFKEEKSILGNYTKLFSELESNKKVYKKQIKSHLSKAVDFQNKIANMTGNTLEELKTVGDLNQKLEQFQKDAEEKLIEVRKNLTEKYGIETPSPESNNEEEINFNLDKELNKLTKIKELLGSPLKEGQDNSDEPESNIAVDSGELAVQTVEADSVQEEEESPEPKVEFESQDAVEAPEEGQSPEPESETSEETGNYSDEAPEIERFPKPDFVPDESTDESFESEKDEEKESGPEIAVEEEKEAEKDKEKKVGEQDTPEYLGMEDMEEVKIEVSFQEVFDNLEKYRKGACEEDNGEVSYFQKDDDQTILDGECLISALNNSVESATELYNNLEKTESPKEQFFIKQDIIRHQEILRKLMLTSIKMCDHESCTLPKYTIEILNVDVLKNILEKVSMENWSDKDDFNSFDEYAKQLKDAYYARITPPAIYLQSILNELEK